MRAMRPASTSAPPEEGPAMPLAPIDWAVLAAGLAAILWVNWYFFLAERSANAA